MLTRHNTILVLMTILLLGAMARAQDTAPSVTVSGTAAAPVAPELLRLTLLISAQGSDIRDAIAKLKQERDDVKGKLLSAGAIETSLKFTDPAEGAQGNLTPQQQAMQRLLAMQRNGGKAPASQPSGSTVSTQLTAEWSLPTASPDDALIAANELEAKIKGAIPKPGEAVAKTPEEEEIAQETAAQTGADASKPDEPKFVFVHKLTEDERAKLLSEALANAQSQANRLAAAAGKQVGHVIRISSGKAEVENPQNAYIQALMDAQTGQSATTSSDDEATGDARGSVNYTVSATVTFLLR
jgi:uncharacterized protein YggE